MTGKGDTPRPLSVSPETLDANWRKTFPTVIDDAVGYDETGHYCPSEAALPKPHDTLGDPEE